MRLRITAIFLLSVLTLFAHAANYLALVDAGSTGSRMYIYQVESKNHLLPQITKLASLNITPGLATYAAHPEQAGPAMQVLLDFAAKTIQENHGDVGKTPLHIMATAGMRLLPETKQTAIYKALRAYIHDHSALLVNNPEQDISTISGQMEGVFDWLEVNYLQGNLPDKTTTGALDMGGASTQIVYQVPKAPEGSDYYALKLGSYQYDLFSHSFLGFGLVEVDKKFAMTSACFPREYPISETKQGDFNFERCQQQIKTELLEPAHVSKIVPESSAQFSFLAFSGYYYTAHFFAAEAEFKPKNLQQRVEEQCQLSWDQFKASHPGEKPEYLPNYCLHGVYIITLLEQGYHFPTVSAVLQVKGSNIEWPRGMALWTAANARQ